MKWSAERAEIRSGLNQNVKNKKWLTDFAGFDTCEQSFDYRHLSRWFSVKTKCINCSEKIASKENCNFFFKQPLICRTISYSEINKLGIIEFNSRNIGINIINTTVIYLNIYSHIQVLLLLCQICEIGFIKTYHWWEDTEVCQSVLQSEEGVVTKGFSQIYVKNRRCMLVEPVWLQVHVTEASHNCLAQLSRNRLLSHWIHVQTTSSYRRLSEPDMCICCWSLMMIIPKQQLFSF